MAKIRLMTCIFLLIVFDPASSVLAEAYSIYEIQYTTDSNGDSPLDGMLINECHGGIVTCVFPGTRTRIVVQDPNYPDGWGAIQVKDIDQMGYLDNISIGDYVRIFNVTVKEFRGTTFLQMIAEDVPSVIVVSSNNPVPEPLVVDVNEIVAPVYESGSGGYFVADHSAEKYESMLIRIENVIVTTVDLGKNSDNYVLQDYDNPDDPNFSCWASDYLNNDMEGEHLYHSYVVQDRRFCSITGILEQYTRISHDWDYYQLLTTYTCDLKRYTPADISGDCMVDFSDFAEFCQYWLWGTE
jgi:hypothetical protein